MVHSYSSKYREFYAVSDLKEYFLSSPEKSETKNPFSLGTLIGLLKKSFPGFGAFFL
jgi:ribosome biogenesis protein Nip4